MFHYYIRVCFIITSEIISSYSSRSHKHRPPFVPFKATREIKPQNMSNWNFFLDYLPFKEVWLGNDCVHQKGNTAALTNRQYIFNSIRLLQICVEQRFVFCQRVFISSIPLSTIRVCTGPFLPCRYAIHSNLLLLNQQLSFGERGFT